ncbi:ROK family protein (plasmid) [Arthrobacter citreus]|nr:ROK family protein [Arthrobacter citreus]
MKNRYYLTFDVGGFFIRGGVLNHQGELITDKVSYYPSNSAANREQLLGNFIEVISRQILTIMDKYFVIDGIGFAFPGPFDYENGICLIKGVNKFNSLYGVDLRTELMERLNKKRFVKKLVTPQFRIIFKNNVNMFALGEWYLQKEKEYQKIMYLTIGNGTGSAFLEKGELVSNRDDVPQNGWVYNLPFHDSIVDDYISNRGILRISRQLNIDPTFDLEDLAKAARAGQPEMKKVFQIFGEFLGEMLLNIVTLFNPDALVIGGQISKSYDLYKDEVLFALKNNNVSIKLSNETSNSTFIGLSKILL